ncbi:bacteriocin [Tenacibaculum finnmarkense]|uniref:bacteriocin n=1 Tax=Tenacibaculum finnmarkense TaxID=2781243 RepID=UPI001E311056|nr:bacteriocin [Tenacibaculum finnmarkense]MCG8205927.1 bacteriocin [Tenacibaculum finnmarkense genomovar finnmarkense]MCD8412183.1 bacteriocin [Tenacibaculum finnmarkense genomovar ulcerans]MCG8722002.1 bacteriocin [Tenacibaculum finnmarkense]MCG8733039.1 bacteriocin [Tenacibaculum finnmarkense]MCG8740310.1 bacteriocin [Tenacibaculum finnmarkense]
MLKSILNLNGAQELSKNELKKIQGGRSKCRTLEVSDEIYGPYNGGVYAGQTCTIQCRPSFLRIGYGSWSDAHDVPC